MLKIDVSYKSAKGEILVCKDGNGLVFDEDKAKEILLEDEIEILVKLGDGNASAEAYGCDLTYDYVKSTVTTAHNMRFDCVSGNQLHKGLKKMDVSKRAKVLIQAMPYIKKYSGETIVVNTAETL